MTQCEIIRRVLDNFVLSKYVDLTVGFLLFAVDLIY